MRKHILTALASLPLLINWSYAAQRWQVESPQLFGIPSEDSGTGSYLGVDIADITSDRLDVLKLKEEKGVEVTMVDQDAPAGKAGIREHDVILSMNGTAVESKPQLQRMIHETPPGRLVTLGLSRDGQAMTIKVQLGDRRSEFHAAKSNDYHFEIPPIPNIPDIEVPNISVVVVNSSARSGLMVENLTPQLGEFFGARDGNGVLVRSVEKGSRGERAGLRAGDVIVRVGSQSVHDTSDFSHALQSHSGGSVGVGVIRDKKEQTITISLPGRRDSGQVIEESSQSSDLDADTQVELSEVQEQIAKLQPQVMELAAEQTGAASREMQRAFREQQKQMKEQAEKWKLRLEPMVQEELRKSREKLHDEMRELNRELSSAFDI